VEAMKLWVDTEYDEGRTTVISDKELDELFMSLSTKVGMGAS